MINVAVAGCAGRMGSAVVDAVSSADDMHLTCGIDPFAKKLNDSAQYKIYDSLQDALDSESIDVMVDFTAPNVVENNVRCAISHNVNCVIGTTGMSNDTLEKLSSEAPSDVCIFYAPNFTTGAVLMMQFAAAAAPYFGEAEVIEYHHCNKKDAPSGTAMRTADIITQACGGREVQAPGSECEIDGASGARGAQVGDVFVHSVRSMGYVASQEVIFGSMGQTLTIRHDSWDRTSYMPGVLLGIRSVKERSGLIIGLENFMK